MSDPTPPADAGAQPKNFRAILKALVGKPVTVVNPESYEAAPMGFQLKEGYYPGKIGGLAEDFVLFHTVVVTSKKEGGKVPVKQFIPIQRIKRISLMKDGTILHL